TVVVIAQRRRPAVHRRRSIDGGDHVEHHPGPAVGGALLGAHRRIQVLQGSARGEISDHTATLPGEKLARTSSTVACHTFSTRIGSKPISTLMASIGSFDPALNVSIRFASGRLEAIHFSISALSQRPRPLFRCAGSTPVSSCHT